MSFSQLIEKRAAADAAGASTIREARQPTRPPAIFLPIGRELRSVVWVDPAGVPFGRRPLPSHGRSSPRGTSLRTQRPSCSPSDVRVSGFARSSPSAAPVDYPALATQRTLPVPQREATKPLA